MLKGTGVRASQLDAHNHMCDLLYLEGPVLSLFRDSRQNWLYLWCDTDEVRADRWLLFPVARDGLVGYLQKQKVLRELLVNAPRRWLLTVTRPEATIAERERAATRSVKDISSIELPDEYLPSEDSYFDERLAPDISLTQEVVPTTFDVIIDGDWFVSDLNQFSRIYAQLYAFFYCTQPRFITNIGEKIGRYLHAPWQGGFSRVNLFRGLTRFVPSLHDLRVRKIRYASRGEIEIEALASVGKEIDSVVARYLEHEANISSLEQKINQLLSSLRLAQRDLSMVTDDQLPLNVQNREFVERATGAIAEDLGIVRQFTRIASDSPNSIVSAKLLVALVKRVSHLADLRRGGLVVPK